MVNEMRSDIAAYLAGNLLQAADYTRWQTLRKWSERNKATVIAAVAIGLAVIATFTGIRWQLYKLQEERRRTVSMEKKVSKADQALKLKSEDFDRLADVQAMHELLTEAEALWPRRPRLIGRYQAWLKRAYNLASKEDTHRKTMARLKKLPQASKAQKALLSALTRLVSDIQTL